MSTLFIDLVPGALPQDGDLITSAVLRAIARPTVTLNGTIGTATLDDDSITTQKLKDNVLSADYTGRAKMEDGYITEPKFSTACVSTRALIDANVTLAKLSDTGATAKATPIDGDKLILFDTADLDAAKTVTVAALRAALTVVPASQTAASTLSAGVTAFDHGLAATPSRVRGVLVCQGIDGTLGYAANDEVELLGIDTDDTYVTVGANATQVWVTLQNTSIKLVKKDGSGENTLTPSKWKIKVYYAP